MRDIPIDIDIVQPPPRARRAPGVTRARVFATHRHSRVFFRHPSMVVVVVVVVVVAFERTRARACARKNPSINHAPFVKSTRRTCPRRRRRRVQRRRVSSSSKPSATTGARRGFARDRHRSTRSTSIDRHRSVGSIESSRSPSIAIDR